MCLVKKTNQNFVSIIQRNESWVEAQNCKSSLFDNLRNLKVANLHILCFLMVNNKNESYNLHELERKQFTYCHLVEILTHCGKLLIWGTCFRIFIDIVAKLCTVKLSYCLCKVAVLLYGFWQPSSPNDIKSIENFCSETPANWIAP